MSVVGRVESLWRYPVKSMRGEQLRQAFVGFAGVYGDRFYAFVSSGARKGHPYLTVSANHKMLLYQPAYRYPEQLASPPNLAEAEALAPGVTPIYPDGDDLALDVTTPSGDVLAVDDPALKALLQDGLGDRHQLRLVRSHRAMIDCRPVSIFSLDTVRQLGEEIGVCIDKRRFRANIYVDLESKRGFAENEFVGRRLRIGPKAVIAILERDPRCKMITVDPDSAEASPEIMRWLAGSHDGYAGVYGAVLVEGMISPGDEVVVSG